MIFRVSSVEMEIWNWIICYRHFRDRDTPDKNTARMETNFLWDTGIQREGPFANAMGRTRSIRRKGKRRKVRPRFSARRWSPSARIDIVLSSTFLSVFRSLNAAAPSHLLSRLFSSSLLMQATTRTRIQFRFGTWKAMWLTRVEGEVASFYSHQLLRLPFFLSIFV